jgi:hypothetical protein
MPQGQTWQILSMLTMKVCGSTDICLIFAHFEIKSPQFRAWLGVPTWYYVGPIARHQFHHGKRSFKDWICPQSAGAW